MTIETQQFPLLLDGGPAHLDGALILARENNIGAEFFITVYGHIAYVRDAQDFYAKPPYGEGKSRLVASGLYRLTVPALQDAEESWQPGRAEYVPKEGAEADAK